MEREALKKEHEKTGGSKKLPIIIKKL